MRIAITGGIGSGKSCVTEIFKSLGYYTCSCDAVYKELLHEAEFVKKISAALNIPPISHKNGKIELDREKISATVFSLPEARETLESITHPAIMEEVRKRTENLPLSFIEVPLLFEKGLDGQFDGVIVVMRDKAQRVSAVKRRDGLTEDKIENRIKNQIDYENFNFSGHTVIYNDSDLEGLKIKAVKALEDILKKNG